MKREKVKAWLYERQDAKLLDNSYRLVGITYGDILNLINELETENERLTSLYDGKEGFMTSSIGDLPLTVEGLRKAVDEITRLNRVETELQELNAKYYNEAKDLRREVNRLKAHAKINDEHLHVRIKDQARKETARDILREVTRTRLYDNKKECGGKLIGYLLRPEDIKNLEELYKVEVEE